MRKTLSFCILTLTLCKVAGAQDLDRLRERASEMWVQRLAGDKTKAGAFVQEKDRANFLSAFEPGLKSAQITGFEFSSNAAEVKVTTRTRIVLPVLGELDRVVVEQWVWTDRNWYMHTDAAASSPFTTKGPIVSGGGTPGLLVLKFELLDREIDLGEHNQGDLIAGSVKFRGTPADVRAVRVGGMPGLRFKELKWDDANGGTIEFIVDTTTISEDINGKGIVEVLGQTTYIEPIRAEATFNISAKIRGQLRVTQSPEVLDLSKDGRGEIRVQNLRSTPVTLKRVLPVGPGFDLDVAGPFNIAPGQVLTIPFTFLRSAASVSGHLSLLLAPGVMRGDELDFPLKIQPPVVNK